jgi:hypothetical protein
MTTEKMPFQMDGTDVTAVLMSCLLYLLWVITGSHHFGHKIVPIKRLSIKKRREMQQTWLVFQGR